MRGLQSGKQTGNVPVGVTMGGTMLVRVGWAVRVGTRVRGTLVSSRIRLNPLSVAVAATCADPSSGITLNDTASMAVNSAVRIKIESMVFNVFMLSFLSKDLEMFQIAVLLHRHTGHSLGCIFSPSEFN